MVNTQNTHKTHSCTWVSLSNLIPLTLTDQFAFPTLAGAIIQSHCDSNRAVLFHYWKQSFVLLPVSGRWEMEFEYPITETCHLTFIRH